MNKVVSRYLEYLDRDRKPLATSLRLNPSDDGTIEMPLRPDELEYRFVRVVTTVISDAKPA